MLATLSGLFSFGVARGLLPEGMVNPAKRIEKFKETARERFLTAEEFERLGAALREAETIGLPYSVDETKPNAKHAPRNQEKRITIVSPFATAAIRLLIFTGLPTAGDFAPPLDVRRRRARDAASPDFQRPARSRSF